MAITPRKLGKYTLKTYDTPLYTWDPSSFDKTRKRDMGLGTAGSGKKFYCTATPYSQGEDWITTYVYDIKITPAAVQQRIAYVACDYVQ